MLARVSVIPYCSSSGIPARASKRAATLDGRIAPPVSAILKLEMS
jgi:hypothetical protein